MSGPVPYMFNWKPTPLRCNSTAEATANCGYFSWDMRPTWTSCTGPMPGGCPFEGWKFSRSTPSGTKWGRAPIRSNSTPEYREVTTTISKRSASRRFQARTAERTTAPCPTQSVAISSSRSWLSNTVPTLCWAAQVDSRVSDHLSEHSMEVGPKDSKAARAALRSRIIRYEEEIFGAPTSTIVPASVTVVRSVSPGMSSSRSAPEAAYPRPS